MAERVGSLFVELDLDGTNFVRNMSKVRTELSGARRDFGISGRDIERSIKQGLGAIGVEADIAVEGISKVARATKGLTGVMATLGQVGLVAGAGLAAFWIGNQIANGRDERALERITKQIDAEKKFLAHRKQVIDTVNDARSREIAAGGASQAAALRGMGRDDDAIEVERQTALDVLAIRERAALVAAAASDRAIGGTQAEAAVFKAFAKERAQIEADHDAKRAEVRKREETEQIASWQRQAKAEMDSLTARLTARLQFIASMGQSGVGAKGSAASGFSAVRQLRADAAQRVSEIVFNEQEFAAGREGLTPMEGNDALDRVRDDVKATRDEIVAQFGHIPGVMDFVRRALDPMIFGNFRAEVEKAQPEMQKLTSVATTAGGELGRMGTTVANLVGQLGAGSQAAFDLTQQLDQLRRFAASTREELNLLGAASSSRPALNNTGIQPAPAGVE